MSPVPEHTQNSLNLVRRSATILMLAGALVATGCVSTGHYAAVNLQSEPPGAEVVDLRNDTVLGTTPFRHWWETTSSDTYFVNVRFQKPGYQDKTSAFYINPRHGSRDKALKDPHFIKVTLDKSN